MFHKIKDVNPMSDYRLCVQFAEGVTKVYDVKLLFERIDAFKVLEYNPALFNDVTVDVGAGVMKALRDAI